jgi:hypothetical protein
MSIFFIITGHIRYSDASTGYVFNVSSPHMEGDPPNLYWRNSDTEVRPVACIDSHEYCSSDGSQCWLLPEETDDPDFELTRRALLRSTIADAIMFRMGRALLAQDAVTQYISEQLAPNQWEIEFEQLFAASLARMQYNLLDIAVGAGVHRRKYVELEKDTWGNGRLCGNYKFRLTSAAGGKNFDLGSFVAFVVLVGILLVFTLPWIWLDNAPDEKQFLGEKVPVYLALYRNAATWIAGKTKSRT